MDAEGAKFIEKEYGLAKYFALLEKSMGGDGNGMCVLKKSKCFYTNASLTLKTDEISGRILEGINDVEWILFHTRKASIGSKKDSNRNQGDFQNPEIPKSVLPSPPQHVINEIFHNGNLLYLLICQAWFLIPRIGVCLENRPNFSLKLLYHTSSILLRLTPLVNRIYPPVLGMRWGR
jgi:hypothetical protein